MRDLFAYLKTLPAGRRAVQGRMTFRFPSTSAARSAAGNSCSWTTSRSRPIPPKAPNGIAAPISSKGPATAPNATARAISSARIKADQRFAGGPDPEGKGWVPNITPHADGIGSWSKDEIAEFLKTGLTPDFDSAGGSMAEVIQNTGRLSDADRAAMAMYIASLPPRAGKAPAKAPAKTSSTGSTSAFASLAAEPEPATR